MRVNGREREREMALTRCERIRNFDMLILVYNQSNQIKSNLFVDIKVIQICQTGHLGRKPCSNRYP